MIPPKRFDIFPPDWGMLRRSRRVQICLETGKSPLIVNALPPVKTPVRLVTDGFFLFRNPSPLVNATEGCGAMGKMLVRLEGNLLGFRKIYRWGGLGDCYGIHEDFAPQ